MHFEIQNLDKGNCGQLPDECRSCGWWQGQDDGWPSSDDADSWEDDAVEQFGYWGKLAIGDGELLGFVQFGPSNLFPRAEDIAGSDVRDSFLLACSETLGSDIASLAKSLLVAVISDLKQEEIEHIDAFCSIRGDGEIDCRIFDRKFLSDCGFYPMKSSGDLMMMRLELGGAQPARRREKTRHRLIERLKRRSATPSPAAMCRRRKQIDTGTLVGR